MFALMYNTNASSNYTQFSEIFEQVLDKHAPLQKMRAQVSQMPFVTKSLKQAIMHRSKLVNTLLNL